VSFYAVWRKPMMTEKILIPSLALMLAGTAQAAESPPADEEPAPPFEQRPDGPLRRERSLNRPGAIPSLSILENRALVRRIPRLKPPAPAHRKKPAEITEAVRTPDDLSKPYWEWEHATGDWGGVRPWLWERGIIPELLYTGEGFGTVHGGLRRRAAYRGNVDLTLTVDTGLLGLWSGGTLFVYWENAHGRGISEREVGALQAVSSIEAHEFTQVSEFYYQQMLFDGGLRVKFGKQDANVDFAALDYAVNFLHSSFGLIPNVPMPTFPDPALGVAAFAKPVDLFSAAAGVYDARDGTFSLIELALKPTIGGLPGTYRAGAWLHDADAEAVGDRPDPAALGSNHGFYLGFDQTLYPEAENQGLGAFFQLGWAPKDRNEIALYVGGGLAYTGPFPGRDADVAGIGVARANLSERLEASEGRTAETAVEAFYRLQLMPWMSIQPDVQFVLNPGGSGRDALVLGARTEIAF
jgi:porin